MHSTNILIITPSYPDEGNKTIGSIFVKRQIQELKKYVENIYVVVPVSYYAKLISLNTRRYSKSYSYDNVKVFYVNTIPSLILSKLKPFRGLRYTSQFSAIERLIESECLEIDLIHAHFSNPSGILASMFKKKYGYKYLITVHENSNWFREEYNSNDNYIINSWRSADTLIRVNNVDLPRLREYNTHSLYIGNGFSPNYKPMSKDSVRWMLKLPKDIKVLFGFGILSKRKGYHHLIVAMKRLREKYSNLFCYIAGVGPEYDNLQKQITNEGLSDCCYLLGFLPDEEIQLWLNAADLFILPSEAESFGIVQIEALACGTPVIAFRNDGSETVLVSDKYGLICDENSANGLERAISSGLEKEWDETEILKYSDNFTWAAITTDILKTYHKVLKK